MNKTYMNQNLKSYINYELNHPSNTDLKFECLHADMFSFDDFNYGVYSHGKLMFNSKNTTSTSSDRKFIVSDGYLMIPHETRMFLTGGTFTAPYNDDLKYAVCMKGYHHLIDAVPSSSIGDVNDILNTGSPFRNIYMGEKLKERTLQEEKLEGSKYGQILDSHETFVTDNVNSIGEMNNCTSKEFPFQNSAFVERNKHFVWLGMATNGDNVTDPTTFDLNDQRLVPGGPKGSCESQLLTKQQCDDQLIPYCYLTSGRTMLVYRDIVKIPLATISDFYKNLNYPIQSLANFKLEMLLNLGTSTITYALNNGGATNDFSIASVAYSPSVGRTCPLLVSSASSRFSDATNFTKCSKMVFTQTTNGTAVVAKISNSIGWPNKIPARCYLPMAILHDDVVDRIYASPKKSILYHDYDVDETQRGMTGNVSFQINTSRQRAVGLYIIPMLSNTSSTSAGASTMIAPYASPVSSCPNTCSFFKLADLQIRTPGGNVFLYEVPKFSHMIYDHIIYPSLGKVSGNATNALYKSGLVTPEMFDKAYGVIRIDLATQEFLEAFNEQVQPNVTFRIVSAGAGIKYDFLFVLEYLKQIDLDIVSCTSVRT
jgi:hypothetical protein